MTESFELVAAVVTGLSALAAYLNLWRAGYI